jgi:hypothetical protein
MKGRVGEMEMGRSAKICVICWKQKIFPADFTD